MNELFGVIGVLALGYGAYSLYAGRVTTWTHRNASTMTYDRTEQPGLYYLTVGGFFFMGVAMLVIANLHR